MAAKSVLKRIIFRDGAWDGQTAKVVRSGSGRAERWAKAEGEIHVYEATDDVEEVTIEHDTRTGKRYTTETAVVYRLVERKPDLAMSPRSV